MSHDRDVESVRRQFQSLLDRRAGEPAFQQFFAQYPSVLACGLPLPVDVQCLLPRGRPGRSEADFVFVRETPTRIEFGVIELKAPTQPILKSPRKRVVTLTSSAATAVAQAREYAGHLEAELLRHLRPNQSVVAHPRMYVVMGVSGGRTRDLTAGLDERQLRVVFPGDVRFVTYDQILVRFIERSQVRAQSDAVRLAETADHYVMLPAMDSDEHRRRPFRLAAPSSWTDAMRRAGVTDISVYSYSAATASSAECRAESSDDHDVAYVYLFVTSEGLFLLTTRRDRVVAIERYDPRDEREALAAAGALDHLLHMSLDPDVRGWWLKSADELGHGRSKRH